jgi:hypothetical protein
MQKKKKYVSELINNFQSKKLWQTVTNTHKANTTLDPTMPCNTTSPAVKDTIVTNALKPLLHEQKFTVEAAKRSGNNMATMM